MHDERVLDLYEIGARRFRAFARWAREAKPRDMASRDRRFALYPDPGYGILAVALLDGLSRHFFPVNFLPILPVLTFCGGMVLARRLSPIRNKPRL